MSKVWINVVLSTGEILIGKISLPVNVSDDPVSDILDLFENDILWSIELENCHKVIKKEKDILYQSITDLGFEANMIISLEHIISISILKDDSEILSHLKVIRKKIVKIRKSSKLLKLPNIPFNI